MPRGRPRRATSTSSAEKPAQTIRERAYWHIHQQIAKGVLKGGSALSEVALAAELGSSRTPIREAIGQLVAEGLLEQTPTGTALVVQLRREDIAELYELREALELYAIEKVATAALRREDVHRLQSLVDEVQTLEQELQGSETGALNEQQMRQFLASDFAFHSLLISIAGNSRIQRIVTETRLLIRIFSIHRNGHNAQLLHSIHTQHQQVLQAVCAGDTALARNVLSEHIRTSLKERLDEFEYWKRESSLNLLIPRLSHPYADANRP